MAANILDSNMTPNPTLKGLQQANGLANRAYNSKIKKKPKTDKKKDSKAKKIMKKDNTNGKMF